MDFVICVVGFFVCVGCGCVELCCDYIEFGDVCVDEDFVVDVVGVGFVFDGLVFGCWFWFVLGWF